MEKHKKKKAYVINSIDKLPDSGEHGLKAIDNLSDIIFLNTWSIKMPIIKTIKKSYYNRI